MSQHFDIRAFRPDDDPLLCDIRRRAVLAVPPRFYGPAALQNWADEDRPGSHAAMIARGGSVLVAEATDRALLGMAAFAVRGASGTLFRLYIDPKAQRSGVGAALLHKAEGDMSARGATQVVLESSLAALAFYEKRGYVVTARTRLHYDDGTPFDVRAMEKTL